MVMRWLTRSWISNMGTAEHKGAAEAARTHSKAIFPLLPPALKLFAGRPAEAADDDREGDGYLWLHDGRVEWWAFAPPDRSLTFQVNCFVWFRKSTAYRRVTLQYSQAVELVGADVAQLERWLENPETTFHYDEVDVVGEGRFEHRHLLRPAGEFGVRFSDIALIVAPLDPTRLTRGV